MIKIIANGFGVLSTLCFIISFQIKSNKALFVMQSIANVFYGTQFYLLGARGGLFNMGMQILRNMLLIKIEQWTWLKWKGWAPLFCVPSLIYMIFTWSGPLDLLPFIAMAFWHPSSSPSSASDGTDWTTPISKGRTSDTAASTASELSENRFGLFTPVFSFPFAP